MDANVDGLGGLPVRFVRQGDAREIMPAHTSSAQGPPGTSQSDVEGGYGFALHHP